MVMVYEIWNFENTNIHEIEYFNIRNWAVMHCGFYLLHFLLHEYKIESRSRTGYELMRACGYWWEGGKGGNVFSVSDWGPGTVVVRFTGWTRKIGQWTTRNKRKNDLAVRVIRISSVCSHYTPGSSIVEILSYKLVTSPVTLSFK